MGLGCCHAVRIFRNGPAGPRLHRRLPRQDLRGGKESPVVCRDGSVQRPVATELIDPCRHPGGALAIVVCNRGRRKLCSPVRVELERIMTVTTAPSSVGPASRTAHRERLRSYILFTLVACLYLLPFMRLVFIGDEG